MHVEWLRVVSSSNVMVKSTDRPIIKNWMAPIVQGIELGVVMGGMSERGMIRYVVVQLHLVNVNI